MKTLLVIFVLTLMLLLTGCSKKTKTIENSNKDITLTIYAHNGESESENIIYSLGHAWLSIENNKDSSLYFSNYEIKSGEALYFGSWGSSAKWGVCYNMEPQFASKYGRYDGTISLSIGIDEKQVDKLAEFALANDHWNIFQNCSWFATSCWNYSVDDEYDLEKHLIYTPSALAEEINEYDSAVINKKMENFNSIFYFDKNNEMVVLELCD